jgi:hypothetical protein
VPFKDFLRIIFLQGRNSADTLDLVNTAGGVAGSPAAANTFNDEGDRPMKRATLVLAALALLLGGVGQARADYIVTVTLDTTVLTKYPSQGPFDVGFQFQDFTNGGSSINNNTAKISNFNLHGGMLTSGTGSLQGSASGDINPGHTLTLNDNSHGQFLQQFTPGSTTPSSLSFTLDLTTNVDPLEVGNPDQFEFLVGSVPSSAGLSALLINITGPNPQIITAGFFLDNGVPVPAPTVAPEPASLTLLGIGSLGLLGYGWRRRKQVVA